MTRTDIEDNARSCRSKMRRLFTEKTHSCLAHPLTRDDPDDNDDVFNGVGIVSVRRHANTYQKLPQQLINLSVLKLDGATFDVQIARNATVTELKLSIEDVFTSDNVSWSHVWGHFCLCYDGQKLINNRANMQMFGIKDGDQIHFIRHLSINYSPLKSRTKHQLLSGDKNWRLQKGTGNFDISLSSTSKNCAENEKEDSYSDDEIHTEAQCNAYNLDFGDQLKQEKVPITQFKKAHFLRGKVSYSKLWDVLKKGLSDKNHPSLFSSRIAPRMLQL